MIEQLECCDQGQNDSSKQEGKLPSNADRHTRCDIVTNRASWGSGMNSLSTEIIFAGKSPLNEITQFISSRGSFSYPLPTTSGTGYSMEENHLFQWIRQQSNIYTQSNHINLLQNNLYSNKKLKHTETSEIDLKNRLKENEYRIVQLENQISQESNLREKQNNLLLSHIHDLQQNNNILQNTLAHVLVLIEKLADNSTVSNSQKECNGFTHFKLQENAIDADITSQNHILPESVENSFKQQISSSNSVSVSNSSMEICTPSSNKSDNKIRKNVLNCSTESSTRRVRAKTLTWDPITLERENMTDKKEEQERENDEREIEEKSEMQDNSSDSSGELTLSDEGEEEEEEEEDQLYRGLVTPNKRKRDQEKDIFLPDHSKLSIMKSKRVYKLGEPIDDEFRDKVDLLLEYYRVYHTCNVPNKLVCKLEDGSKVCLGRWLSQCRYKMSSLRYDRRARLQQLVDEGKLCWTLDRQQVLAAQCTDNSGWEERYELLLQYAKQHQGDCNVPSSYRCRLPDGTEVKLGAWLYRQRALKKKNKLHNSREARLQILMNEGRLHHF